MKTYCVFESEEDREKMCAYLLMHAKEGVK